LGKREEEKRSVQGAKNPFKREVVGPNRGVGGNGSEEAHETQRGPSLKNLGTGEDLEKEGT